MLLIQDQEQNLVVSSETGRMWESVSWLHATDGPLSPSPQRATRGVVLFRDTITRQVGWCGESGVDRRGKKFAFLLCRLLW